MVNGRPLLTATLLQGRSGAPFTGVVRIDAVLTRPVLYAGLVEPGGSWPNRGAVAPSLRAFAVAAFNSGFIPTHQEVVGMTTGARQYPSVPVPPPW
jgi:hypothetical protein